MMGLKNTDQQNLRHYWHFHIPMMNLNLFETLSLTSHLYEKVIADTDMNNNLMELLLLMD
jgi:hypothetical protein